MVNLLFDLIVVSVKLNSKTLYSSGFNLKILNDHLKDFHCKSLFVKTLTILLRKKRNKNVEYKNILNKFSKVCNEL
jgi:hypothetical protein